MQSSSVDVVAFDMYDKHVACCYARIVAEIWTLFDDYCEGNEISVPCSRLPSITGRRDEMFLV